MTKRIGILPAGPFLIIFLIGIFVFVSFLSVSCADDNSTGIKVVLKHNNGEIRTESRSGIYGNYPQAFGNYFFGRLSGLMQKSGMVSELQVSSDIECGVRLIEVNEAKADGLLSWIYKRAWAISEVSCAARGREIKRTVNADTSDIYLKHNSVVDVIWRTKTIPTTSPGFQSTPVGVALNGLAAQTHKAISEISEFLLK
ncbi:MAG: hypothetical protein HQL10_04340 [Nitrospirae bacterium]|nr:hypothetical protein [Nitrospirota bacterium]